MAFDFPALTGRVVDQANVIPAAQREALESKLQDLEDKSGIQLVVTTVSLQGGDIESFANELFRNWKLGEAKKNNGVLLLIAPSEPKSATAWKERSRTLCHKSCQRYGAPF